MLNTPLIHPLILASLGRAGHGSQILISDGNYPHSTASGPNAEIVYLNLSPGCVSGVDVLKAVASVVPIEQACVMGVNQTGPHALAGEPAIWQAYRAILSTTDCGGQLTPIERFAFYGAARGPDLCLTIATGEQQIYANLLLTIGVVAASRLT